MKLRRRKGRRMRLEKGKEEGKGSKGRGVREVKEKFQN